MTHKQKIIFYVLIPLAVIVFSIVSIIIYRNFFATTYLLLEPDEVVFPLNGEKSVTVDVNYDGFSYKVSHTPSWISCTIDGNTLVLKATPNDTGEDREALLIVKSGTISNALLAKQKGKATHLFVSPPSLNFGGSGGKETLIVDCDGPTFNIDSSPSWVSAYKTNNMISVVVDENTTSSLKEGTIMISSGDLVSGVNVKQGGATSYIRFEPTSLTLPKGSASHNLSWTINLDYDGYDYDVTYHTGWLHVDMFGNQLFISAEDNDSGSKRTGSITIKSGDISKTLYVNQYGETYKLDTDIKKITDSRYGGKTARVNVKYDGTLYTVNYPSDLTVSCFSDYFTVTFPYNDGEYRKGSIVVNSDKRSKSITIEQGGKCNICHGKGKIDCSTCGGHGGWNNGWGWHECYVCKGAHKVSCYSCKGEGYREPN